MADKVVTAQPVPSAPMEHLDSIPRVNEESSALVKDSVVVLQPTTEKVDVMLSADAIDEEEQEKRRRRNEEYCCYACADSYNTDDVFCWYYFWRLYCQCLGRSCQCCYECTDGCCEGCSECMTGCCECCADGGADTADAGGDCCDCGDCDCDCGDCDCDCGDCDCSCFN